ncbi:MAG: HlyD family efflux transporter periplasmic adaptor subunit [Phycisphaerae bacterium]|nr:HlyD family efflux transporter periplasmic adaptor subunit [Phycisphaerae bacterium]
MAEEHDPRALPQTRRRRRLLVSAVPVLVWIGAILAAVQVYRMQGAPSVVTGHVIDAPVTLARFEPGVVREVLVELYDSVREGQMIVAMDDEEERTQLAAIEADLKRLRGELEAERARLQVEAAVPTAGDPDRVRQFAVDRESAHLDYLAQLMANARDRLERHWAGVEYEIMKSMAGMEGAPPPAFDTAETHDPTGREVETEDVSLLPRAKEAFEQSDLRWARLLRQESIGAPEDPVLASLRLAIDARRRDLEEIIRRIDTHVLRSPIDGQIIRLDVRTGDHLPAGVPLAVISPTTAHEVVAYLPESLARSFAVGARVSVEPVADLGRSRTWIGTVSRLSAAVTEVPVRSRPVPLCPAWGRGMRVTLPEEGRLIPGEAVRIAPVH